MKIFYAFFVLTLISCSTPDKHKPQAENVFEGMRGCFLLYNLKTDKFEQTVGDSCQDRLPACSTFKVPLSVMAFDSGVLKNKKQTLKWDGKKRFLEAWNKDHNAETWMKESVVWFSQRITPKLGIKKLSNYLQSFQYGNEDISSGLTTAWINSPNNPKGSLAINAYEQVEFMKKLWRNKLPVKPRAMELTREITYLETSPNGFRLNGKTGSNFYDAEKTIQLGWFISHISKGDKEYIAITNISDLKPVKTDKFGGYRAKEITKSMLAKAGLW